jgi:hypothetical protein
VRRRKKWRNTSYNKYSYDIGNDRWKYPEFGYTISNYIDKDTTTEKNNVADNRKMQENEGT